MKQMVKVNVIDLYDVLWTYYAHEEVKDLIKHTCHKATGKRHAHTCPRCKTRWRHSDGSFNCPLSR
jgi:uncharacterized paraquat-inducible protein A